MISAYGSGGRYPTVPTSITLYSPAMMEVKTSDMLQIILQAERKSAQNYKIEVLKQFYAMMWALGRMASTLQ